ncbi:hypothetical protein ARAM_001814 [Aspergillus rambellii]|uniref:Ubiquitin-like protease family profile domain-containing protein n=1 Tax=Aspergillus rambellii TaxID=308745 RepID=A0A0F8X123_9EURO|nr:hypothetical protein ARAM_001814 [Aspergillus rambellii]
MADRSSAEQLEMEDVVMKDASVLSTDDSRLGFGDGVFDPMEISTPSPAAHSSQATQTIGFCGAEKALPDSYPTFIPPGQRAAPLYIRLGGNSSLGSHIRAPVMRPRTRFSFSPKSRSREQSIKPVHPRLADLQPYQKPRRYNSYNCFSFAHNSQGFNSLPGRQAPSFVQAPTTRDSSFSSIDTQKSTDDGKANSFDSATSISTSYSSSSRKRSTDDDQNDQLSSTSDTGSRLFSKYRRVSDEGSGLPSGPPETSDTAGQARPLDERTLLSASGQPKFQSTTSSTPIVSPTSLSPGPRESPVPTYPNPSQDSVPGCWPGVSYPIESSSPPAQGHTERALMPGALLPPNSSHITKNKGDDKDICIDEQPLNSTWRTYWSSLYDTITTAVKSTVSLADSIQQRVFGIFEKKAPSTRRSSPAAKHSPVRANIRALPTEQRRRLKDHQWRKDRGYPTVEDYPFPELSFDGPYFPKSPEPAVKVEPQVVPSEAGPVEPTDAFHQPRKSVSRVEASIRRQLFSMAKAPNRSEPTSGVRKVSRVDPVSPQLKRRMLLRTRTRDPERARRERALLQALRTGNFDAFNEIQKGPAIPKVPETDQPLTTRSKPRPKVRFQEPLIAEPVHEEHSMIVTELAPHLHPSNLQVDHLPKSGDNIVDEASLEQKENIPPLPGLDVEFVSEAVRQDLVEPPVDPWLQPQEFPLGRPVSAVSLFYPISKPLPPGRTKSLYADIWRKIEEEEKLKLRPIRIRPEGPAVRPLTPKWEARVDEVKAMPNHRKIATTLSGDPLTRKDLATCFTPGAWLNDEVINSYLALIIDYLRRTNGNAGRHDKPKFHAFNSFFFSNLRDKGYESVRRWASRAKIGGEALLNVDTVFVPVHNSSHWTLIIVKPSDRTIENFDSLGSLSRRHVAIVKTWLRGELGSHYVDEEWTVLPSISPQQDNGSDCGVFLLSTAKAVAIDIEPMSYGAKDTRLLRKKIVAELMNGGLDGDFDPTDEKGDVLL